MCFGHGISHPVYQDTAQEMARDLLAAKVSASLQTDGLELRSTLASLGASDEEDASTLAMSIGQGIYQRLTRGYVPERLSRGAGAGAVPATTLAVAPARPPLPPLVASTTDSIAAAGCAELSGDLVLTPLPLRALAPTRAELPVLDLGPAQALPQEGQHAPRADEVAALRDLFRRPDASGGAQLSFADLLAGRDEERTAS